MPTEITYKLDNKTHGSSYKDVACWTAFRAGAYVLPDDMYDLDDDWNSDELGNSTTYKNVEIMYSLGTWHFSPCFRTASSPNS